VVGSLALTEHYLGKTGAEASVVVHTGKSKIRKRELGKPGHRGLYRELSICDLRQEFVQSCFVHGSKP